MSHVTTIAAFLQYTYVAIHTYCSILSCVHWEKCKYKSRQNPVPMHPLYGKHVYIHTCLRLGINSVFFTLKPMQSPIMKPTYVCMWLYGIVHINNRLYYRHLAITSQVSVGHRNGIKPGIWWWMVHYNKYQSTKGVIATTQLLGIKLCCYMLV